MRLRTYLIAGFWVFGLSFFGQTFGPRETAAASMCGPQWVCGAYAFAKEADSDAVSICWLHDSAHEVAMEYGGCAEHSAHERSSDAADSHLLAGKE